MHNNIMAAGPYTPTTVVVPAVPGIENSPAVPEQTTVETVMNMTPKNKAHFESEKEAIHLILTRIGDEIYSTIDAFNELRAERIAKNAKPLTLVATAQTLQDPYYQSSKSHKAYTPTSKALLPTRSHATIRYKGKEIAKPITPPSESASEEDSDPEQAQRDKDMQKNLALIAKYFKKIYKPTNNNLRTFSNTRNKNVDTTPRIVDQAWVKHSNDRLHIRNPTAQDMEILIKTCLMPLALKTQNDSFAFVHELKQEMHADLMYVESLENELESDKAEFSNMYDMLLQECVSNDIMCSYLQSSSDLDEITELQCLYLHKVRECDCLAQKLSEQTEFEREQYFEIQDLKAQLQDKNIAISELKKLIEKWKGKSVDTKFDKPSVVRQPNAQRIPKPSVLGKPTPFSDSLERTNFAKKKSVSKTNESEGLSKPVTLQNLPQTATQAVRNTNVIKPGMYRIASSTTQTRAPQLTQTSRNTNPRVSTSTGVAHRTNVSRPQPRSNQMKDKVLPNTSQVKFKKTEVEDHPRISRYSYQTKSVTTCNNSLNSKTSNVNVVCAACRKCVFNSNHDACVSKFLNDVNARTKKPHVVLVSTRKPKSQANKSVATPHKKTVALESTTKNSKSYYRMLYKKTLEMGDTNVTPDSPDMCDNDIQNGQNDVECDDERVALANLIANLKLDVDENKKIQKQLKKANATLTQELTECKSILAETSRTLGESNSIRDSCLVALQNKQTEFERYKAFNDRIVDYDKLERKLNETLGLLAQKEIDIKEGLKVKAYEISVVKEKHDELVKQSLLTKSHYEGLVKEKTKVITDLKLKEEKDIDKMISMENQLKFLNEIVYKRSQSIQTIHMLAPKCPTFNGRPTFANPMYLKKAQNEIPCLYAIPHDQSDPANRLVPDREETRTLDN
ncbi:hypothetical protein Tco_0330989 [Tanacetum coccineum]